MPKQDILIQVKNLCKSYGEHVIVDHLNMTIKAGQVYGFLGPNGSGKTTTMRMLCGLIQPDDGEGHCLGYDIRTQSYEIKQRIGYMPQLFSYYKELSVRENLSFLARLHQLPNPMKQIETIAEKLGLTPYLDRDTGQLSGGWKQLVSFAGAMLHQPKVLLLDEPTAGLDVHARSKFWNHLYSLTQEGLTILVSTHYMDEAERCTNLAYLQYGTLYDIGSARTLSNIDTLKSWQLHAIFRDEALASFEALPFTCCVNAFGGVTMVSTKNHDALLAHIQTLQQKIGTFDVKEVPASTEDAFLFFVKDLKRQGGYD